MNNVSYNFEFQQKLDDYPNIQTDYNVFINSEGNIKTDRAKLGLGSRYTIRLRSQSEDEEHDFMISPLINTTLEEREQIAKAYTTVIGQEVLTRDEKLELAFHVPELDDDTSPSGQRHIDLYLDERETVDLSKEVKLDDMMRNFVDEAYKYEVNLQKVLKSKSADQPT